MSFDYKTDKHLRLLFWEWNEVLGVLLNTFMPLCRFIWGSAGAILNAKRLKGWAQNTQSFVQVQKNQKLIC